MQASRFNSGWSRVAWAAMFVLLIFSWIATYIGLMELVAAESREPISLSTLLILLLPVGIVQILIIIMLSVMFSPRFRWFVKALSFVIYIVCLTITVGFSFGFFWKYMVAGIETGRGIDFSIEQVEKTNTENRNALERLQQTLVSLKAYSDEMKTTEEATGNTCGKSAPGPGPRKGLRQADARRFGLVAEYVDKQVNKASAEFVHIDASLKSFRKGQTLVQEPPDPSVKKPAAKPLTDEEQLRRLNGMIARAYLAVNGFPKDPQLRAYRDSLEERMNATQFSGESQPITDPSTGGNGAFTCPDARLREELKAAISAIDAMRPFPVPRIVMRKGAEATSEAIKRLMRTATTLAVTGRLPPTAEELRERRAEPGEQTSDVPEDQAAQQAGLGNDDWLPLFLALFVDGGILICAIIIEAMRFKDVGMAHDVMRRVYKQCFGTEPAEAQFLDPLRHVMIDHRGELYAAVPVTGRRHGNSLDQDAYGDEANYLQSTFMAIDRNGLARLQGGFWSFLWGLSESSAREKLKCIQSPFVDGPLRIYKFDKGVGQDIYLLASDPQREGRTTKSDPVRRGPDDTGPPQSPSRPSGNPAKKRKQITDMPGHE